MLGLIIAAQAATPTVVVPLPHSAAINAERAFAADAQKLGQWTAFRKWAAPDALMFVPQPIAAHTFLKDRKDPPVSVFWWPGKSFVSCDGLTAVNTGPWVRGGGKAVGYFTTVWKKQPDGGWQWIYDAGDQLRVPRAEGGDIAPIKASCAPVPRMATPVPVSGNVKSDSGQSRDGTLTWQWIVWPDGRRTFIVRQWTGKAMKIVLHDKVAAE